MWTSCDDARLTANFTQDFLVGVIRQIGQSSILLLIDCLDHVDCDFGRILNAEVFFQLTIHFTLFVSSENVGYHEQTIV